MQHVAPERPPADLIALVDELIAAYVTWRSECSRATRAYRLWSTSGCLRRDVCFGLYVAALDREERAATTYRGVLEQITTLETELPGWPSPHDLIALPGSAGIVRWSARNIIQRLGL